MIFAFSLFVYLGFSQENSNSKNYPAHYIGDGDTYDLSLDVESNKAVLYIADRIKNEPLINGNINLQSEDQKKPNLIFNATKNPGMYEAKISGDDVLKGYVMIDTGTNNDAIEIKQTNVQHSLQVEKNLILMSPEFKISSWDF